METMKRQRKRHSKSRNGCLNCKRLRIKCDEKHPTCENCIKRDKKCEYVPLIPRQSRQPMGLPSGQDQYYDHNQLYSVQPQMIPDNVGPTEYDNLGIQFQPIRWISHRLRKQIIPDPRSGIIGTLLPSDTNIKFQDFELIHHYTIHAEKFIMFQDEADRSVWLHIVPKISFGFPYLSDAMLALSGLHLNYVTEGKRDLHNYSLQKYFNAMAGSQVHDISSSAEAKFLTSCFLMMLAFAFEEILELVSEGNALDVFGLARGPRILAERLFSVLVPGPLSPMLFDIPDRPPPSVTHFHLPAYENLLVAMEVLRSIGKIGPPTTLDSSSGHISSDGLPQTDVYEESGARSSSFTRKLHASNSLFIYRSAIDALIVILKSSLAYQSPPLLISWITMISNEFLQLARQKDPFTAVIIAYHMAALHSMGSFFWVGGRPTREVKRIASMLPSEWYPLMMWPLMVVERGPMHLNDLHQLASSNIPIITVETFMDPLCKPEPI